LSAPPGGGVPPGAPEVGGVAPEVGAGLAPEVGGVAPPAGGAALLPEHPQVGLLPISAEMAFSSPASLFTSIEGEEAWLPLVFEMVLVLEEVAAGSPPAGFGVGPPSKAVTLKDWVDFMETEMPLTVLALME
jgi:hypothetical protein